MATTAVPGEQADERLAEVGFFRKLFQRPEVGALLGAIAIFLLFSALVPDIFPTMAGVARVLDPASTIGIMAVSVALLLIGGEFNLSVGVLIGTSSLIIGLLTVGAGWSVCL